MLAHRRNMFQSQGDQTLPRYGFWYITYITLVSLMIIRIHDFWTEHKNIIGKKWEAVFRRLSQLLASPHPGQNSHAFVVGIWYVVPQEQVRWNWILSNSSLESGTLQCWLAFYCRTLNAVWKELFFTDGQGVLHMYSLEN